MKITTNTTRICC